MTRTDTIAANIMVHTKLADSYDSVEPHFRPENQTKVKRRLSELRMQAPGGKLLDVGCGTGFIIHLAAEIFDEIHGVDVTKAMMDKVRKDLPNVVLHERSAEDLPFDDCSFDAATAYSFIDHLDDPGVVLSEVRRVLKPGGRFYMDLLPNRMFWHAIQQLPDGNIADLSDIVQREVRMVTENAKTIERNFGVDAQIFIAAEPGKRLGGIDPNEFRSLVLRSGFSRCEISFDWLLGQGSVMHDQSVADADTIDRYLKRLSPLSNQLYKYLYIIATR